MDAQWHRQRDLMRSRDKMTIKEALEDDKRRLLEDRADDILTRRTAVQEALKIHGLCQHCGNSIASTFKTVRNIVYCLRCGWPKD